MWTLEDEPVVRLVQPSNTASTPRSASTPKPTVTRSGSTSRSPARVRVVWIR